MDPLDVLTNIEKTLPYYQAIFSADGHRVIGYEVLARFQDEGKLKVSAHSFMMMRFRMNIA